MSDFWVLRLLSLWCDPVKSSLFLVASLSCINMYIYGESHENMSTFYIKFKREKQKSILHT